MLGKNLNSGVRGGLWDVKHYGQMGDAIWLFGWLVHRQTIEKNGVGLVLRGKALTYRDIMEDTGFAERTLHRWMAMLVRSGYITVRHSLYSRMVISITNAKKFKFSKSSRPQVADITISPSRPVLADMGTKSGLLKEGTEIEQKLQSPLPPVNGGQQIFEWCGQVISVNMGRKHRLPNLSAYEGGMARDVVEFLTRRGFPAQIVNRA